MSFEKFDRAVRWVLIALAAAAVIVVLGMGLASGETSRQERTGVAAALMAVRPDTQDAYPPVRFIVPEAKGANYDR